ncbi:peptidase U32 [Pirellula staleyi DSM 6068]|uniref:Peptidase U32 n=1 Tax=Pirellula staleyi (strain ATCC 27377 / DSM 6068 / ICPB 4128) TaxID=530564 RepID=D2R9C4_PIRSD|nr:U32 family peptidase [Pirellula staleyi]ADB17674.1 peptidase U32 [Pirellula staleyi DSM 6068]
MNAPSAASAAKPTSLRAPELLAPAGSRDAIRAAIENGADAVYFGLDSGFNARARAANFAPDELPEIMEQLHSRGVKGYVTLNTLIFPSELPVVEALVKQLTLAGVDAVLVQDLGLARLIRAITPDLPMHASTQMTLSSSQCIAMAEELGIERVVLPRELSLDEIRKIRSETTLPVEVFVHGALCVSYSGQYLTSESLGGRSANRGQCAQACRLPYDLVCDGKEVDLGDQKYLLSPQDLAAFSLIPELVEMGVASLKIEGRLKTPEYVANITRHYRQAIDQSVAGQPVDFTAQQIEEMELSFSRGFSVGWMRGCDHKMLVPATNSSKRGVFLGKIVGVRRETVVVQLASSIKRGDGVVFDCGKPVDDSQGGRVYEVFRGRESLEAPVSSGQVELAFAHGSIDFESLWVGQQVWKNDDPQLTIKLRKSFESLHPIRRMPIDIAVQATIGEPLKITVTAPGVAALQLASEENLQLARKHPLSEQTLRDQFDRLGGTPYELRNLSAVIQGEPMLPLSLLGKLRHAMTAALDAALRAHQPRHVSSGSALADLRSMLPPREAAKQSPQLALLCRTLDQLRAAVDLGLSTLYADLADIREYKEATAIAADKNVQLFLATTRIQKPDEMGIFRAIAKHCEGERRAAGILVRNLSGMRFFAERGTPWIADYSLNVANDLTAALLHEKGAQRITPSYDLNRDQLVDLVSAVPPAWLEVVVHQHMPMFHMEHCVFCAVLSPGTNKTNCGRPCDTHDVKLRDRVGMLHPLKADVGCRNTLFNATPQSAAEVVPQLLKLGVQTFRVELLDQKPDELPEIVGLYQQLLADEVSARDVWSKLKAANRTGVTRGTLEERRDPLAIL